MFLTPLTGRSGLRQIFHDASHVLASLFSGASSRVWAPGEIALHRLLARGAYQGAFDVAQGGPVVENTCSKAFVHASATSQ